MESEEGMKMEERDAPVRAADGKGNKGHGPTWRGFVLSILVAIVLSVMATLLLGGSWFSYNMRPAAAFTEGGYGGPCCPLAKEGER